MKHFQEALKSVRPSCLRSSLGRTELSPVAWDQIGGLDEVKLKLRQVIEIIHPLIQPLVVGVPEPVLAVLDERQCTPCRQSI